MAMAGAAGFTINSFVFIDLETSHLYSKDRPTITEMSLIAVNRKGLLHPDVVRSLNSAGIGEATYDLSKVSLPRIIDKLTLCLDPRKYTSPQSSSLTKLDKQNLDENKKLPFNEDVVSMLGTFLSRQEAPICLVAHNGNRFDYPILRSELSRLSTTEDPLQDVYCVDSLIGFRAGFTTGRKDAKKESACVLPEPNLPLKRVRSDYDNPAEQMAYLQKRCSGPFDQRAYGGGDTLPDTVISAEANLSSCNDVEYSLSPGVSNAPVQGRTASIIRPRSLSFDLAIDRQLAALPQQYRPPLRDQPDEAAHTSPFDQYVPDNTTPQWNFPSYPSPPPPLKKARSEPYYRSNNSKPKRPSYSQVNIFKRTFGREPPNSHSAEDDAVSLIKVLLPRMSEFVPWADVHATQFKNGKLYYTPDCQA